MLDPKAQIVSMNRNMDTGRIFRRRFPPQPRQLDDDDPLAGLLGLAAEPAVAAGLCLLCLAMVDDGHRLVKAPQERKMVVAALFVSALCASRPTAGSMNLPPLPHANLNPSGGGGGGGGLHFQPGPLASAGGNINHVAGPPGAAGAPPGASITSPGLLSPSSEPETSPCPGLLPRATNVGPECWALLWVAVGCKRDTVPMYEQWHAGQSLEILFVDAQQWATLPDAKHREQCYGKDEAKALLSAEGAPAAQGGGGGAPGVVPGRPSSAPSSHIKFVSSSEHFVQLVQSAEVSIVNFGSEMCGFCTLMAPVYELLAEKYVKGKQYYRVEGNVGGGAPAKKTVQFLYVDVQAVGDVGDAFGVQGLPAFRAVVGNAVVPHLVVDGADTQGLEKMIEQAIALANLRNVKTRNLERYGTDEELVIVGAGPAGLAAALYAARAGLCPLVLAPRLTHVGQLLGKGVDVENYPGAERQTGAVMVADMKLQVEAFGVRFLTGFLNQFEVVEGDGASAKMLRLSIQEELLSGGPSSASTSSEASFDSTAGMVASAQYERVELSAKAVIIATGATSRWLGVPGEEEFKGKGVSSCAACDGFLYRGKRCGVIGGGDTALEEALFLTRICAKPVLLVHRRSSFRASKLLQSRVLNAAAKGEIDIRWQTVVKEFLVMEPFCSQEQDKDSDCSDVQVEVRRRFTLYAGDGDGSSGLRCCLGGCCSRWLATDYIPRRGNAIAIAFAT
eukprot:g19251.t1